MTIANAGETWSNLPLPDFLSEYMAHTIIVPGDSLAEYLRVAATKTPRTALKHAETIADVVYRAVPTLSNDSLGMLSSAMNLAATQISEGHEDPDLHDGVIHATALAKSLDALHLDRRQRAKKKQG